MLTYVFVITNEPVKRLSTQNDAAKCDVLIKQKNLCGAHMLQHHWEPAEAYTWSEYVNLPIKSYKAGPVKLYVKLFAPLLFKIYELTEREAWIQSGLLLFAAVGITQTIVVYTQNSAVLDLSQSKIHVTIFKSHHHFVSL